MIDIDCGCVTGHALCAYCIDTGETFYEPFLSETGNKVQAHKGVFWLIEDKLLTFPFEKNRYQSSVSKSGDTYVHKYLWKRFLIQKFHTTFIQEAELKLRNVEVQLFI